jgi:M6 family metalloprotease-like protein
MYILRIFFSLYIVINSILLFGLDLPKHSSNPNPISNPYVIAIMVEFQEDNNPLTSGNGLFIDSLDITMISDPMLSRCNQFILDRPPHNAIYFTDQIEALSNYYKSVSNENLNINGKIISNPNNEKGFYKLSKEMELYAYSDNTLSELFKESLELAKIDIELHLELNPSIDFSDIIFTVFHAGIGQDFSFPTFDPTVYDIKSAYLEPDMFGNIDFPIIDGNIVSSGILLPESQNMLFFSSIEDIFYGEDSYCDYQLGMTGTFSFLMGYALGLPPLFNTETGDPGIGIFGLMDYGSNNGRGIIPSLPTPWTRILMNWSNVTNLTTHATLSESLVFNVESSEIYKFDLSDNQYFLIENKINSLDNGQSLRDIVSNYNGPYDDNVFPDSYSNWLDAIISNNNTFNIFEFSEDSIITSVISYDLGLPQSGILLWHINEPITNLNDGINNNPNDKSISIEEADGALDIGFESYALFSNDDPTSGTKWDFWYQNNEAYHYANNINYKCYNSETYSLIDASYNVECINNGGIWIKTEVFDQYSNPNSNLSDNTKSFFSFEILDTISDNTRIKAYYSSSIPYSDINYSYEKILGTSSSKVFFGLDDGTIFDLNLNNFEFSQSFDGLYSDNSVVLTSDTDEMYSNIYNINTPFGYLITNEWNHELVEVDSEFWVGTFLNLENDAEILTYNDDKIMVEDSEIFTEYNPSNGFSIADIDKDGLHEIIFINTSGQIIAYNGNGTLVDGFPMGNNYHGVVLIVSEKDTDDIVMISRNLSHINLVWLNGDLISIPSINEQSDLMILSNYLTDGSRYYDLDSDESFFKIGEDQYWTQRYNSHSHYPLAKEPYQFVFYPQTQNIVDNFYNYPNPIKDGKTKFRFFINEPTDDIKINIFNIAGNLVDSFSKDNLVIYEYNEIEWNTDNFFPGLYYAEILSSNVQQDIIKVVIGH